LGVRRRPSRGSRKSVSPRSLKVSDAFKSFVLDQLDELGDVVPRSMFGGVGLYCRGVFFGILARDVLYLKVDDTNRPDYERAGMKPFNPYPDRSGTMQYYAVPVGVLETAPELVAWARKAVAVAGGQRRDV
jgi:DNA transformation protein